jgi:hypothetical protein
MSKGALSARCFDIGHSRHGLSDFCSTKTVLDPDCIFSSGLETVKEVLACTNAVCCGDTVDLPVQFSGSVLAEPARTYVVGQRGRANCQFHPSLSDCLPLQNFWWNSTARAATACAGQELGETFQLLSPGGWRLEALLAEAAGDGALGCLGV